MSDETKYTDPTGLDKVDYDKSQVSPEVKKHTKNVRTKMYGRDVRESIARAIEFIDLTAQSALNFAKKAFSKSEDTENRLDNQIRDLTNDSEIIDLRYSKMLKKTFNVLKDRGDFWDDTLLSSSVKVMWFGAIGDGKTDDSDKIKNAIKFAEQVGKPLEFESNRTYIINEPIIIKSGIALRGDNTTIKVKDNSNLFHNISRTENINDLTFPNLFYDFHSVLLYIDSDVDISGITIDGNAQNQFDIVEGDSWNYVTPDLYDKSRNYYKYFHGIQVFIPTKKNISVKIHDCEIKFCTWNDLVIGNRNGDNRPIITGDISNNTFRSSSNDLLSLHRFKGNLRVKNNKFINPAQHSTHCYYDVNGVFIEDNEYQVENDRYIFYPVKYDEVYHCVLGHHYNSIVENIVVRNNLFINKQEDTSIVDIFTLAILKDIDISENRGLGSNIGINISYPILGQFKVDKNTFHSKNAGLQIRLFNSEGKFNYLGNLAQEPYNTNGIFSDNIFTFSNESGYSIDIRDTKNAEIIDKSRMSMFLVQLRYNTAIRNNYVFSDSAIQIRTKEIGNYRSNILNNLQYLELDSKGFLKNFIGRGNTNEFTGYVLRSQNFVDVDGKSKKTKIANIQSNNPNYATNQIVASEEVKIAENSILSFACGADKNYIIRVNIDDLNGNLIKTFDLGTKTPINELKMITIPLSLKGEELGVRTKISIFFISENDIIRSLNLGAIKLENVVSEFDVASARY